MIIFASTFFTPSSELLKLFSHDADADVTATTNVAMVCSQRMRNASGIDDGSMVMTKTEKSRVHFKI